jgi:Uma2 family endonuclease
MKNTEETNIAQRQNEFLDQESSSMKVEEPPIAYYAGRRYSYADYLLWTDEKMREIIDGIVYLFSAPVRKHEESTVAFVSRAWTFIRKRKGKCKVYTAPFDVRFPIDGETDDKKIYNVVQPDIVVVCDPAKLDEKGCIGAPDLIVEVLSPSTFKYDCNYKFNLYEAAGVKEYWIVDPKAKTARVFLLQPDGRYDFGTVYECNQKAPVHIFEGLEIDMNELFEEE